MVERNDEDTEKKDGIEERRDGRSGKSSKGVEPVSGPREVETDEGSDIEIEYVDDDEPSNDQRPLAEAQERLETVEEELERVRELYLRKLAEFDNFRRRVEREKAGLMETGAMSLIEAIIPVLDNFERALAHADAEPSSFREGVEMIAGQLREALAREGLEALNPTGEPFDPEVHEAVGRIEDPERPAGTVAEVVAKGYTFRDRLVRPAIVAVVMPSSSDDAVTGEDGETA